MTPKDLLDNFDKLVRQLAISHVGEIQGGSLGEPTMDDLSRCGRLHALLESGGMLTRESLQNACNPKETAQEWTLDDLVQEIISYCRCSEPLHATVKSMLTGMSWDGRIPIGKPGLELLPEPPIPNELTRRQSQLISELQEKNRKLTQENHRLRETQASEYTQAIIKAQKDEISNLRCQRDNFRDQRDFTEQQLAHLKTVLKNLSQ